MRIINLVNYTKAAGAFAVMIHIFACVWIYIGANPGQWMTVEQYDQGEFKKKAKLYVDALYFITSTMTSVGYGDISAYNQGDFSHIDTHTQGDWSFCIVMVTQVFGILGFSLIKEQIFKVHITSNIKDIVKQTRLDVEDMLYLFDKRKEEELDPNMYDEAMDYMGIVVQFSIAESFSKCEFYKDLPSQLQTRLAKEVLDETITRYKYFFNDYVRLIYAPSLLVQ